MKETSYNAEQIELYHNKFNRLINLFFMDTEWKERYGNGRKKTLRVLTYCLLYRSITPSQLLLSNITPAAEKKSEEIFLYRLEKKGYLSKSKIDISGYSSQLYTITKEGVKYCEKELRKLIPNFKQDADFFNYIFSRAKGFSNIPLNAHGVAARELNCFLFSFLNDTSFRYQLETTFDRNGILCSYEKRKDGNILHEQYSLQSDAYISIPDEKMNHYFYLEQDMNTQRHNILQQKILNYVRNIWNNRNDEDSHNILFSLLTKPSQKRSAQISYSRQRIGNLYNATTEQYIRTIYYIVYILCDEHTDFWNVSMKDVQEELFEYCRYAPVGTEYYKNISLFLGEYLKEEENMLFHEFYEIVKDGQKENLVKINSVHTFMQRHRNAYSNRKNVIKRATEDMHEITEALLEGLSVYTSPTRKHASVFPYLCPRICKEKEKGLFLLLTYHGFLCTTDKLLYYHPYSIKYKEQVLKNHYSFSTSSDYDNKDDGATSQPSTTVKDGTVSNNYISSVDTHDINIYVENIGDDLGGRLRVQHYLDLVDWNASGILLCLLDEDDISLAKELYINSSYYRLKHEMGTTASVPLDVYFITYKDFDNGKGIFTFSIEGNISQLGFSKRSN